MNTKTCPNCNAEIPETSSICPECKEKINKCPRCGQEIPKEFHFCFKCGEKFSDVTKTPYNIKERKISFTIMSIIIAILVIIIIILVIILNSKDSINVNNNTTKNNQTTISTTTIPSTDKVIEVTTNDTTLTTISNTSQIIEDTSTIETIGTSTNNDIIKSGQCGDNLTWSLDKNMTLTISGTGAMYDFKQNQAQINSPPSNVPWEAYANNINDIILEYGITHIGDYAFYNCSKVDNIIIPNSVTSLGDYITYNIDTSKVVVMVVPPSVVEISENSIKSKSISVRLVIFGESNTEIETISILNGFGFVETHFNPDGSTDLTLDDFRNLAFDKAVEKQWIITTIPKSTVKND